MWKRRSIICALGLCFLSSMVMGQANGWDGAWGRDDYIKITVQGGNVDYRFKGTPYRVTNVQMSPSRLSFLFGDAGSAVLVMNGDGTAQITARVGSNSPLGFKIWRGRRS